MSNNIKIEITPDDFDKIQDSPDRSAIDKKLGIIFKTVSAQQQHCQETVTRIEKSITSVPKAQINKVKAGGALGGATGLGITAGYLIDRVIDYITK